MSFSALSNEDSVVTVEGGDGLRNRSLSRRAKRHGTMSNAIPEDDALFAVQDDQFSVFAKVFISPDFC